MYDGVDLRLVAKHFHRSLDTKVPLGDRADEDRMEALAKELREHIVEAHGGEESYGYTKVQHSSSKVGLALLVHSEIRYVVAHLSSLLLAVDRSTAECILATLLRQSFESPAREGIARKIRVSESDGADYNPRAERGYKAIRPTWSFLRFQCEIHFDAGTFGKVYGFSAVKPDITGMIQSTLALNSFGMMVPFRVAARKALDRMLVLVDECDVDAAGEAFKELVLDTFVGRDPAKRAKRETIRRLAPGDWRLTGIFQWERRGEETRAQVLELLFAGLLPLLYHAAPFDFPRNRWTGSEKTYEDVGLPTNMNGFQNFAWREFRAGLGEDDDAESNPARAAGSAGDALPVIALEAAAREHEPDVVLVGNPDQGPPPPQHDAAPGDPQKNKEHLTIASKWLATDPGFKDLSRNGFNLI